MIGTRIPALAAFALLTVTSAAGQLRGRVETHSFLGPVLGNTVHFNIYLPEGYDESTRLYPVIYFLHGMNGDEGGPSNVVVPQSFEEARAAGIIGPVMIVFANGYLDTLWADSIDGLKPAEIDVAHQLIPYVDAHFRSAATGGTRAIMGFSMGGFGAPKFYTKFPDRFAACIAYDGSLVDWNILVTIRPDLAAAIFGNSQAYFAEYSPWYWAATNAAVLATRDDLRLVIGVSIPWNTRFRNFLTSLDIPADYVETGCPHDLSCMLAAEGLDSAAFIANRLSPVSVVAGDLDCDRDVDFFDIEPFVAKIGCPSRGAACDADCPWQNADVDGSGAVDFFDIDPFVARLGTSRP